MHKKISKNAYGKIYEYYICSTYRKKSNKLCSIHKIKIEELEEAVLEAINYNIKNYADFDKIIKMIKNAKKEEKKDTIIEETIKSKNSRKNKISKIKLELYEDLKNEIITKEEYIQYKKKYETELEIIEKNIENLEKELNKKENKNEWIEKLKKDKKMTKITRNILEELIEAIYVYEEGKITIKFKFNCC